MSSSNIETRKVFCVVCLCCCTKSDGINHGLKAKKSSKRISISQRNSSQPIAQLFFIGKLEEASKQNSYERDLPTFMRHKGISLQPRTQNLGLRLFNALKEFQNVILVSFFGSFLRRASRQGTKTSFVWLPTLCLCSIVITQIVPLLACLVTISTFFIFLPPVDMDPATFLNKLHRATKLSLFSTSSRPSFEPLSLFLR